jgi:diaminohydroxyphosphoribosylaminopyrimidine deaminase/5-amino-6-(5-phosphoribosylamino)uracil reductase
VTISDQDQHWMIQALQLAERGLYTTDPNPRVGCILVRDGTVVGQGWHRCAGEDHAEIIALKDAGNAAQGATVYVTLEPCSHFGKTPPCATALLKAGVHRVVVAMKDSNPLVAGCGIAMLLNAGIVVDCGVQKQVAETLNKGFCKRMRSRLPWVMSKLAVSLDGRTSLANGDSKWITSLDARHDVHRLRARSSALMTAAGTVRADNPALTARLEDETIAVAQPVRVVLDTNLGLNPGQQVFSQAGRVIVFTLCDDLQKHQPFIDNNVQVCVVNADEKGQVSIPAVLQQLAEFEMNEVMIEAGPILNGRLLESGVVDEWIVYQAAVVLGHRAHGMFNLAGTATVGQSSYLQLVDVRKVGVDLRLHYLAEPTDT